MTNDQKLVTRPNLSSANVATADSSPLSLPLTVADTGCTSHFFTPNARLINVRPVIQSLPVTTPNGAIIYSSDVGELDLSNLPPAARIAHVFPDIASDSLLSIGQLCDTGCTAFFTKDTVTIKFDGDTVLTGAHSPMTRLWHTPIPPSTQHHLATGYANAAKLSATPAGLVSYAHASLGSPVISTLSTALDNHYVSGFPGLTPKSLRKYPPQSLATAKGHLDQTRKTSAPLRHL